MELEARCGRAAAVETSLTVEGYDSSPSCFGTTMRRTGASEGEKEEIGKARAGDQAGCLHAGPCSFGRSAWAHRSVPGLTWRNYRAKPAFEDPARGALLCGLRGGKRRVIAEVAPFDSSTHHGWNREVVRRARETYTLIVTRSRK